MKLYGTVTSERAKKAQGGNKWLNYELAIGTGASDSRIVLNVKTIVDGNTVTVLVSGGTSATSYQYKIDETKGEKNTMCKHIRTDCPICHDDTKGEQRKDDSDDDDVPSVSLMKCRECYKIDPTGRTDCPRHRKSS